MKLFTLLLANTMAAFFSAYVFSHAPELHQTPGAEKPQCEALQTMDRSTMDTRDPVVQAMLTQCDDWLHDKHEQAKHQNNQQDDQDNHHH